ncbi:MAG: hypothetical protein ACK5YQ_06900 [Betaproteobacteria bacterium]|jgi:hypothetical protein|nr:hypothetical protein [Rhodocyclaceae bacterium]
MKLDMLVATGALLVVCAAPARGADWDHDANIEAAVGAVVASYRQGGPAEMERVVGACYGGITDRGDTDEQVQRLESCAGMDFAAFLIDRRDAEQLGRERSAFFAAEKIMGRVERLGDWYHNPGVETQIIRAWSRSAVEALERSGLF